MKSSETFLSPREKSMHTKLGRIITSYIKETYPKTYRNLILHEVFFETIEKHIDDANALYVKKIHEGLNRIDSIEYTMELARECINEEFSILENSY